MAGNLIGTSNRSAVETCIFVKVGTAIKDLESMMMSDMEVLFYNKYVTIVHSICNECFMDNSVHLSMFEKS